MGQNSGWTRNRRLTHACLLLTAVAAGNASHGQSLGRGKSKAQENDHVDGGSEQSNIDQGQLPVTVAPQKSGKSGGNSTTLRVPPEIAKIQSFVLPSGASVPGRIPLVFHTITKHTNLTSQNEKFVVPEGLVFLTSTNPEKYQFVVVLEGISVLLPPGRSLDDENGQFWTMCIERETATPPFDVPLIPAGILPPEIVDQMNRYKWATDSEQERTRDVVIDQINAVVLSTLGINRR